MSLESLKENIIYEREILKEVMIFNSQLENSKNKDEEKIIKNTINSLINLLKIINNSIPDLISNLDSPAKEKKAEEKIQENEEEKSSLIRVSYSLPGGRKYVTINEKDRSRFLKDLSLSLSAIKKIRKPEKRKDLELRLFKKPSFYAKISNRFFSDYGSKLSNKESLKEVGIDMRKANMPFLLNTYISMGLMSAVLSIFAAIVLFIVLIFFKINFDFPFFHATEFSLGRILLNLLIIPAFLLITLISFYFYPALEKSSIEKKINQELPFVAIHMSAIAGSGIEPSHIFKIIALGEEYPYSRQELKKVINQINVYGYDLVNALKNAARSTASKKIAELFNGFATTISSGGRLTEFLDKRAETLLFEYRLERERFTKTAETFMDIYISVVIAAPMIMMLMLVLINISGISIGLSISALTLVIVLIVALINIIFLVVLHLKQPSY